MLDDFSADITHLTALFTADQLNTLAWIMESILTDQETSSVELMDKLREKLENAFGEGNQNRSGSLLAEEQRFCSEIRPLDAWCCFNRMRGVHFAG